MQALCQRLGLVDRRAIGFVGVLGLVALGVDRAAVAAHLQEVVEDVVADGVVFVDVGGVLRRAGLVDVSLDHSGGDPGVGQVVQVVVGDRGAAGEQQGDAGGRGVVGADVVDDVVRDRGPGEDLVGPDRVPADRRAVRRAVLLDPRGLGRVGGQRIVGAAEQDGRRGDVGELVALDEGVRRAVHHAQPGAAESGEPVTGQRDVVGRGE